MSTEIKYSIEKILTNISEDKLSHLQICLDDGTINKNSDVYDFIEHLHFITNEIKLVTRLFDYIDDPKTISLLLEYGKEITTLKNQLATNSTLVWTSPIIDNSASQTFNTMIQMIRDAQNTITVVGYAIWGDPKDIDPNAAQIKEVFEALALFSKKEKLVELFFEKDENFETLKNNIKKMWISDVPLPKLYGFKKKEQYSSLHAKMLLVDDTDVLVTSANMTGRAVTRNVELGIKTKGVVAENARKLVTSLLNADYFEEEQW